MAFVGVLGLAALPPATAHADSGPVIVIPSRPGIPIIINGRDASYAVVEGDWGLARPGAVPVTVIGGSPVLSNPVYTRRNSYHPKYGRVPERGRNEIDEPADRTMPEPAENFSRSWSTDPITPMRDTDTPVYPGDHDGAAAPYTDQRYSRGDHRPDIIHRRPRPPLHETPRGHRG